ncbi:ribonuclease 3-like protein 3 [Aristolochia californica]|uniref:ribonuclease 3-like protein 3 n=1 Tax=Aristolochia californica TaxID=171875 RepID=UPI0035DBC97F
MGAEAEEQQNPPFQHVAALEEILGYRFRDRDLLAEAMTHPSYLLPEKSTVSYERLEFVGDAVLNCLMAREMFTSYPELAPGPLTKLRGVNVDTEKLARVAVKHQLHRYLRHKAPPLQGQIEDFMEAISDYPVHSSGLVDTPKFLADIVESLMGAVSIDCNYCLDTVWKHFKGLLEPVIRPDSFQKDPTSELHEFCQKRGWKVKFVDTWEANNTITVTIEGHSVGSATHPNRKDTTQKRAAKAALDNLKTSSSLHRLLERDKATKEIDNQASVLGLEAGS